MRKVLYILGELSDADLEWLLEVGSKKTLAANETLIREGRPAEGLYILLSGTLAVVSPNDMVITYLERGEVVGEMSLIEARPPNVAVKASDAAQVFMIPRPLLQRRLEHNEGFAGRFYKAISLFLSDRLRATTAMVSAKHAGKAAPDEDLDELDDKALDNVYLAGTRFEALLKRLTEGRST